jgi:glycosyltransferase involved in cell wall biosynthesis
MVLFHFPPIGGVAVPRNILNAKYLPEFGWTPVVVAPRDGGGILDPDLLKLVPNELSVFRAWYPEPRHLRRIVDPIRARLPRGGGQGGSQCPVTPGDRRTRVSSGSAAGASETAPAPGWFWRLYRLLAFPDNQVAWLPFALIAALRAHRQGRFDVVYSTAAPTTVHLVAGLVKLLTGVPWVAEFRDPWLGNPITEAIYGPRPWLHRRLQVKLERWIMRSADVVVFVSPSTARLYRKRYRDSAEIVTITNGHDRAEASLRSMDAEHPGKYKIVWTGSLIRPNELVMFLNALEAVVLRRPDLADMLRVAFFGEVSDACRAVADEFIHRGPLAQILQFEGFVARTTALQALADADAALVMLGAGSGLGQTIPAKLFDIIGQDQQVLAILPHGDARDILTELNWGVLAAPEAADIERAIEQLLVTERPQRRADPTGKYERKALTGHLADAFTTAAARRTDRTPSGVAGDKVE